MKLCVLVPAEAQWVFAISTREFKGLTNNME